MWVAFVTDNSVHGRGFSGRLKINLCYKYFLLFKAVLLIIINDYLNFKQLIIIQAVVVISLKVAQF